MNKREELEKKIEVYKKNSKAFWDMLSLYACLKKFNSSIEPVVYTLFEVVVKDLEDKDVNVPFKAVKIMDLIAKEKEEFYSILKELRELKKLEDNIYYDELKDNLYEDYRGNYIRNYFAQNIGLNEPYDFIGELSYYSNGLVTELLCSDIGLEKRINILYETIKHFVTRLDLHTLKCILIPNGNGTIYGRTNKEIKEQRLKELSEKFREEINKNIDKKLELLNIIILYTNKKASFDFICYLQEEKLVDFMDSRKEFMVFEKQIEFMTLFYLRIYSLKDFKDVYQLEDYNKLPANIRKNNDKYILSFISINDIPSFIKLTNYEISTDDIKIIGQRLLEEQIQCNESKSKLIDRIKKAIISKAKTEEEVKTYQEFAIMFEDRADIKKQQEETSAGAISLEKKI